MAYWVEFFNAITEMKKRKLPRTAEEFVDLATDELSQDIRTEARKVKGFLEEEDAPTVARFDDENEIDYDEWQENQKKIQDQVRLISITYKAEDDIKKEVEKKQDQDDYQRIREKLDPGYRLRATQTYSTVAQGVVAEPPSIPLSEVIGHFVISQRYYRVLVSNRLGTGVIWEAKKPLTGSYWHRLSR